MSEPTEVRLDQPAVPLTPEDQAILNIIRMSNVMLMHVRPEADICEGLATASRFLADIAYTDRWDAQRFLRMRVREVAWHDMGADSALRARMFREITESNSLLPYSYCLRAYPRRFT